MFSVMSVRLFTRGSYPMMHWDRTPFLGKEEGFDSLFLGSTSREGSGKNTKDVQMS